MRWRQSRADGPLLAEILIRSAATAERYGSGFRVREREIAGEGEHLVAEMGRRGWTE